MIRIINRNYTKEVAKQVLRNAIVTTKIILRAILQTWHQAVNRILKLKNEATKYTDILEDKTIRQIL